MNWIELLQFKAACEVAGLEVPTCIVRGIELIGVAQEQTTPPRGNLLALTDDAVSDRITDLSIRTHQGHSGESLGLRGGVEQFTDQILAEIREVAMPELDRLIEELRPAFEATAKPLEVAAQKYGFTLATTSDAVIEMSDEKASKAWRDARTAWHAIVPLVRLRVQISDVFKVSPTREETAQMFFTAGVFDTGFLSGRPMDYTVCFAAGDNWSYDGAYAVSQKNNTGTDWFALAAGGLTLNTTAQVREKQERKSLMTPRAFTPAPQEKLAKYTGPALLPRYPTT